MNTPSRQREFNIYLAPEESRWLDSMEGVPDWPPPRQQFIPSGRREVLHRGLDWLGTMAPGLALAAALAWIGMISADWVGTALLGFDRSPISAILMTIAMGLIIRNVAGLPVVYEQGLRFCVKRILRFGIVLLGLRLSLVAAGQIGLGAVPIVVGVIASALILVA